MAAFLGGGGQRQSSGVPGPVTPKPKGGWLGPGSGPSGGGHGGGGGGLTFPGLGPVNTGSPVGLQSGPGSGGGGGAGGNFGGPNLNNFAQKDPRVEAAANKLDARYASLQAKEGQEDPYLMESVGNLRNRMSADTTARAIDRASSGAADYAAGMGERAAAAGARMGRGGDFGGSAIEAAAQRLQAKQAADISLGRERDLDTLALGGHNILSSPSQYGLAKSGQTNQLLGQVAGFAPTGAQLGLAQQGLGLEQWRTGADIGYKNALLQQQQQQGGIDNYLKVLALSGYGS